MPISFMEHPRPAKISATGQDICQKQTSPFSSTNRLIRALRLAGAATGLDKNERRVADSLVGEKSAFVAEMFQSWLEGHRVGERKIAMLTQ